MNANKIFLIAILAAIMTVSQISSASPPGDVFYYRDINPQNDLFELVVSPGDTLILGRSYDLTKVYGTSGAFAHWYDESEEFQTCEPDIVIQTSYIATNGLSNKKNIYLGSPWIKGKWYQWDGCYNKYIPGQIEPNYVTYGSDNAMMFTIIDESDLTIINQWNLRQLEKSQTKKFIVIEEEEKLNQSIPVRSEII